MFISVLTLVNFRGFEHETFRFNEKFTVIIGDNGLGKSTILHGLQVAAGAYTLGLPGVYRRHINKDEIRRIEDKINKQWPFVLPAVVEAGGTIAGEEIHWRRVINIEGQRTSFNKADVGKIQDIAKADAAALKTQNRNPFPVLTYFSTARLNNDKKNTNKLRNIIFDGYFSAFEDKSNFSACLGWLSNYNNSIRDGFEFDGTKEALLNAIQEAIPFLEEINFNSPWGEIEAIVNIPGQQPRRMVQSMMSDGLQNMIKIVGEIAYRCVILNGFLGVDAVKKSAGIVMIDEIDMHLHPNWQRHVISDLKNAFPSIQFVATTHSPFIVQSLNSDELINLDIPTDVAPKEMKIDEVATEIMNVDSAYSAENKSKYEGAKKIFVDIDHLSSTELENEIAGISDPTLRAFAELSKMAKGK